MPLISYSKLLATCVTSLVSEFQWSGYPVVKQTVSNICENLVDMDEGFQEWCYRHSKMVERTIGHKIGSGGSSGADYLTNTLKPFFPDLWIIRSQL